MQLPDHPIILTAIALIAAIVAPCYVTRWDLQFLPARSGAPAFAKLQLWLLAVAIQAALWALCAIWLASVFYAGWTEWSAGVPLKGRILAEAVLSAGALAAVLSVYSRKASSRSEIPPSTVCGISIQGSPPFASFGVVLAVASVACMFFVRLELLARFDQIAKDDVTSYLFLASQVSTYLFIATLILSLGTLGTAALRTAINADRGDTYFPVEYVIAYGAVYTLILIIAYIPIKISFVKVGTAIVNLEMKNVQRNTPETLVSWFDTTSKLEDGLGLKLSFSSVLGPIGTILPVVISAISFLLGDRAAAKPPETASGKSEPD